MKSVRLLGLGILLALRAQAWDGELSRSLKERSQNFVKSAPKDKVSLFQAEAKKLEQTFDSSKIPKVGEAIPDLDISVGGQVRKLSELYKNGPVILTFYRGGWCPYCVMELRAYQKLKADFDAYRATILGVSPESLEATEETKAKSKLTFNLVPDKEHTLATRLGLVFTLSEPLQKAYKEFGLDLASNQKSDGTRLPVPATFVIDTKGIVRLANFDTDYTKRTDPEEILLLLRYL